MPTLRELRLARQLSQRDLAKLARVALRTLGSAERGRTTRMDTQRRLLSALGLPFAQRVDVFGELRLKRRRRR